MKVASPVRGGAEGKGAVLLPRQRPTPLYAGETARDIAARKGLKRGQAILDWMGPDELAANLFRASLAEQRLRQGNATTKAEANAVHHQTGAAVRRVIIEQGATVPERLPTPEVSIQDLQRREHKRLEAERQPSLFTEPEPDPDRETGND